MHRGDRDITWFIEGPPVGIRPVATTGKKARRPSQRRSGAGREEEEPSWEKTKFHYPAPKVLSKIGCTADGVDGVNQDSGGVNF